jgi:di/tricarboxylate transporter
VELSKTSLIGVCITTLIGLGIGVLLPWEGDLSILGHRVLMILAITVGLWVFRPMGIPLSLSSFFMVSALIIVGIPLPYIFAGFTSGAVWTLIPALLFGTAILKTGLGKRIALYMLKLFNPTYKSIIVIFTLVGIILSLLTPSIMVRISILLPIALSCIEVCRLKGDSKEGAVILLTSVIVALVPGTGWLTGSLYGPVTTGMFESVPELQGLLTFNTWAMLNLLPAILITFFVIVGGYLILRPSNKLTVTKEQFISEYEELGKITRAELGLGIALVVVFIMFLTNGLGFHQIPGPAIMMGSVFVVSLFGIIKQEDIGPGVNWDNVIFVGSAMGLGTVFANIDVANWIGGILIPVLEPISRNPWVFCFAIMLTLFMLRFVDIVTLVPTKAIVIPALPLINQELGIDPLIWIPLFIIAGNTFFLSYTNYFVLAGKSVLGGKGWNNKQVNTYGMIYGVASLVVVAISIPYWMAIGAL